MYTVHADKGLQQAALDTKDHETRDFSLSIPFFQLTGSTAASFYWEADGLFQKTPHRK